MLLPQAPRRVQRGQSGAPAAAAAPGGRRSDSRGGERGQGGGLGQLREAWGNCSCLRGGWSEAFDSEVAIPEDEPPGSDGAETSEPENWLVFSASPEPVGISAPPVAGEPCALSLAVVEQALPHAMDPAQSLGAVFAAVARAPGEPGGASACGIPGEGSKSPPVSGGGFPVLALGSFV
ncbi:collagen alpha-1(IV) chain-like [Passer montanus]|uniref:collagen alpha-1(IV) chain-like n=1 Tax=Passer montanus TaxID=9160 RepID=UPI00195F3E88|nr:collagen alpha-1(IV) chain-like [Passer montanus]